MLPVLPFREKPVCAHEPTARRLQVRQRIGRCYHSGLRRRRIAGIAIAGVVANHSDRRRRDRDVAVDRHAARRARIHHQPAAAVHRDVAVGRKRARRARIQHVDAIRPVALVGDRSRRHRNRAHSQRPQEICRHRLGYDCFDVARVRRIRPHRRRTVQRHGHAGRAVDIPIAGRVRPASDHLVAVVEFLGTCYRCAVGRRLHYVSLVLQEAEISHDRYHAHDCDQRNANQHHDLAAGARGRTAHVVANSTHGFATRRDYVAHHDAFHSNQESTAHATGLFP